MTVCPGAPFKRCREGWALQYIHAMSTRCHEDLCVSAFRIDVHTVTVCITELCDCTRHYPDCANHSSLQPITRKDGSRQTTASPVTTKGKLQLTSGPQRENDQAAKSGRGLN